MMERISAISGAIVRGAVFLMAMACAHALGVVPWGTIVVGDQGEPERLATVDLQRYLAQVTGAVPGVVGAGAWRSQPGPALVIGTAAGNPLLQESALAKQDLSLLVAKNE